MALKANLNKSEFDALPEALREHYKQDGEDYWLEAEGVEDVSGLKSALQKEKEERRKLKSQLESEATRFKNIDPERAREALAKIQELDEKKLIDQGEFDRLLKKRSDEFDVREVEYKKQIADRDSRLDVFELINPVREAALKAGVLADRIEDALAVSSKRFRLDEKRKPVVLDQDNDPTGMTPEEFFSKEFKDSKPWLYAPSGAAGSGASQSNAGNGANKGKTIPLSQWQQMSAQESTQFFKDGGKVAAA